MSSKTAVAKNHSLTSALCNTKHQRRLEWKPTMLRCIAIACAVVFSGMSCSSAMARGGGHHHGEYSEHHGHEGYRYHLEHEDHDGRGEHERHSDDYNRSGYERVDNSAPRPAPNPDNAAPVPPAQQ
jgi:hypothetical protein